MVIMAKNLDDLVARADQLIGQARNALQNVRASSIGPLVRSEDFASLRSSSLSFIELVFKKDHTYYREFAKDVHDVSTHYTERALGILTAIRTELAGGWLQTTRGLISAEVFADFLEMAEHLLDEGYKDPAAVMVGSVLEEHLRQLAAKFGVAIEEERKGVVGPRKADAINSDLAKAGAYGKLDQKSITGWLDLRNKAAHGKYSEYTDEQVSLLLASVREFVARNPL